ncbi:DUF695 domain-containing protein [Sphingobacterium sp. 1.A.4]|uniref:DUF695 domain-containing protein n=1 Tax=Sphingobacterium sp. 1.A.4 TaxID=2044603 RepID=UPI000C0BED63|nr:DUF695 domain-containing protein [Sphingobacterium sp. 1.A.4]
MSLYEELSRIENSQYQSFWNWFKDNSENFLQTLRARENVEENLIAILAPKIEELDLGLFFLIGIENDDVAELIFTPDGNIQNVYLAEEILAAAPEIENWSFKALKPPTNIPSFEIRMMDLVFSKSNITFYPKNHPAYPDEIDLVMIYKDWREELADEIVNGVYIFLDNFLGEEAMIEKIDRIQVIGPEEEVPEEIPVEKLPEYINWREKEFVEKYQDITYSDENDSYTSFETILEDDTPIISTINTGALNWDNKASHPWILVLMINFLEVHDSGMPNQKDLDVLGEIDKLTLQLLPNLEGYIYIGREIGDGKCELFFACKDYRMPAKIADWLGSQFNDGVEITADIFKDKYWQIFERFNQ